MTKTDILRAESLKIQRGNSKIILNNSSFSLKKGSMTYLSGASGVGKSTLLWTLARMYPLLKGKLWFNNHVQTDIPMAQWRANIALLPQNPVLMSGNIAYNLLYPLQTFCIQKERFPILPNTQTLQKELETVGLADIPLERNAASLSGGQKTRLALIRLLLTRPKLILADEPTTGVDHATAQLILQRLHTFCDNGGSVLFTSHAHTELLQCPTMILNDKAALSFKQWP